MWLKVKMENNIPEWKVNKPVDYYIDKYKE